MTKYLCHPLTIKDMCWNSYVDDGIRTLAYSHKDSITSCKEIKKDYDKKYCEEIKKDCDKKDYDKEDCDNSKIL